MRCNLRHLLRMSAGMAFVVGYSLMVSVGDAAEPVVSRGKWDVLFQSRRSPAPLPLPEDGPLRPVKQLNLKGALHTDPNHLGLFAINGEFGINGGVLQRASGNNTAVQLTEDTGDFELEANVNAEGLGGWFWLLGWKDGHGYCVYNVTLKTSGSPWLISEFRGENGIPETLREFNRLAWKGTQPLKLSVMQSKLTLQVGAATLAKDLELPNYHPGALIVGTYDTQYGPRSPKFQSIRLRPLTIKSP